MNKTKSKIAIIGCGNMARALIVPIANGPNAGEYEFYTFTPSKLRARSLAKDINGIFCSKVSDIPGCDYYFIACKPQQLSELAQVINPYLPSKAKIISVLAAIEVDQLQAAFSCVKAFVRVMPNTPSEIKKGANLIYSPDKDLAWWCSKFLSACGQVFILNTEEDIDQYMLVSGTGPAYVYYFAQEISKQMQILFPRLDETILDQLVRETFLGAASLMQQSDISLQELIDKVTSKGGVTIEAINQMRQNFPTAIATALSSADQRNQELKQLLSNGTAQQ